MLSTGVIEAMLKGSEAQETDVFVGDTVVTRRGDECLIVSIYPSVEYPIRGITSEGGLKFTWKMDGRFCCDLDTPYDIDWTETKKQREMA